VTNFITNRALFSPIFLQAALMKMDLCEQNELVKYADDTYIVIPVCCSDSPSIEIDGVMRWARANNLQLNRGKTKEIIFVDKKQKCSVSEPPVLPGITRVKSLTVLGVTLTTGLSASDHVRDVISKSAQTLYALRVLRAKDMPDEALQVVFQSVIVGKLLYASCAWSGFVSHTDQKRVDAFLQRVNAVDFARRTCRGSANYLKTPTLLCFIKSPLTVVMSCISFYRHCRRPHRTSLRHRSHQFSLPDHTGRLMDCNFLIRSLFKDVC